MLTWQRIMLKQINHEPGTVVEFGGSAEVRAFAVKTHQQWQVL